MGVDFYLMSLYQPSTERYRPKIEFAARERDKVHTELVDHYQAQGLSQVDASDKAKQRKAYQRAQAAVQNLLDEWDIVENGHFRDSYNLHSLLSLFGVMDVQLFSRRQQYTSLAALLSGIARELQQPWRFEFLERLLNEEQQITPAKAREFLDLLAEHETTFYDRLDNFIEYFKAITGEELTPAEAGEWTAGFEASYLDLSRFLNLAIFLDESICVSY